MVEVLLHTAALIGLGVLWHHWRPNGQPPETTRDSLTGIVYYLLLPALVLDVLGSVDDHGDSLRIAAVAATGVLGSLGLQALWLGYQGRLPKRQQGALLLAAGFPNATYLGLPILQSTLGDAAASVAIRYDLFACLPLVLTLGVLIAHHFGDTEESPNRFQTLFRVPALWAAGLAILLGTTDIAVPAALEGILERLGDAVIPLMLIAFGLSLQRPVPVPGIATALPVTLAIQLLAMPTLVLLASGAMGVTGETRIAVVLEGAMPSMILGVVLCQRYGLDTALYTNVVTTGTIVSAFTLPAWLHFLTNAP